MRNEEAKARKRTARIRAGENNIDNMASTTRANKTCKMSAI